MADEITVIGTPQKFSQPDAASSLEWLKVVASASPPIAQIELDPLAWFGRLSYVDRRNSAGEVEATRPSAPAWFASVGPRLDLGLRDTVAGFRSLVRAPIHEYLVRGDLTESEFGATATQLGLGWGRLGTDGVAMTSDPSILLDPIGPTTGPLRTRAFWRFLFQDDTLIGYVNWWNGNAAWSGRSYRRFMGSEIDSVANSMNVMGGTDRDFRKIDKAISDRMLLGDLTDKVQDTWFGNMAFWSMKRLIASMMFIQNQGSANQRIIVDFLLNA